MEADESTLVMTDKNDEDGSMWRAVHLTGDGELAIIGLDRGPGVQRAFGVDEYEFTRMLSLAETESLRQLLGVESGASLLAAIGARFEDTFDLENFVKEHGIPGQFANWMR
jgi:hypothetical protein